MAVCECGAEISDSGWQCKACTERAWRAQGAPVARRPGDPVVRGGGGPQIPPIGGASLLVQKGLADQDMRRAPAERGTPYEKTFNAVGMVAGFGGGLDPEATLDEISRVMKPERDANGRVIWDWKNALVGGIVVAVVVAAIVYWFVTRLTMLGIDPTPHP